MNKKFAIGIAAIVMITVVVIMGSTYYSTLVQMQEYKPRMASVSVDLTNGSPVLGSPDAPITIIEFGDYQCEACHYWFHTTRADVINTYVDTGKANLVFLDLAFLGHDSHPAAQATYCADDQGKYWEYHTTLYNFQEGIDNGWASKDRLVAFAFNLEMDMDEFNDCMDTSKHANRVDANYDQAVKQGAEGTPLFIIVSSDGTTKKISGPQPYSVFSRTLEAML
ncbi:MAG: DsbA family protein [Candidatus Nitrosopelagicus sp.]